MTSLSTGSGDYASYTVTVEVAADAQGKGYYVKTPAVDATINIAKPLTDFVTGGFRVKTSSTINKSGGSYAADDNTNINGGVNVKYTKTGTGLQGNVNIIFRRTEVDPVTKQNVLKTYQIKSTSLNSKDNSLGVGSNPGDPATTKRANLKASANLQDVTNSSSTFSKGGLSLQLNMVDRGEPGTSDQIAITLWDGSLLMFSASWTGTRSELLTLLGGNLKINGTNTSNYVVPSSTARTSAEEEVAAAQDKNLEGLESVKASAYPNPFYDKVTLSFGKEVTEEVVITVVDMKGAVILTKKLAANSYASEVELDMTAYRSGTYVVQTIIGKNRTVTKVIKQQ
jgi:hypothetical protein